MRQNKRKSISRIISVIILCTVFWCGCSLSQDQQQELKNKKKTIKIAIILPASGTADSQAEEERRAIELAVRDVNSRSRSAIIETVYTDSGANPSEAAFVADNLLHKENVSAFITSSTPISQGVLPIAAKNKKLIAMLSPEPKIQTMSPHAFRLYVSIAEEAEQLLEYFTKTGKGKKVVILYLNRGDIINEVSHYLVPGFMHNGIKVLYYEPYESEEKDLKSRIDRLKRSGATSVMILGSGSEALPILQELSQQKLLGRIEVLCGGGFLSSNTVPDALTEGIIVASPQYVFQKNEKTTAFEENFAKAYGHPPSLYAACAYDATNIFAEGLMQGLIEKQGNADTVSFLITNHKYSGIAGEISVDNEGGLTVPMRLGIIHKGKVTPYNKP